MIVTSTYHVTRTRLDLRRAIQDRELGFVAAGYGPSRMPLHVASEWAKLALALTLRRGPQPEKRKEATWKAASATVVAGGDEAEVAVMDRPPEDRAW